MRNKIGVLIVNLGTPNTPTPPDTRRYLRDFLSDRRVVDYPSFIWRPILHGFVLRTRPEGLADAYGRIWTDDGPPLQVHTKAQARGLAARLGEDFYVTHAARYGSPSIDAAVEEMREARVRRIIVFPLFPQFSSATVASVYDEVVRHTLGKPGHSYNVPTLRFVPPYYNDPGYIDSLRARVQASLPPGDTPDHIVFSYRGVPRRYIRSGEPYQYQCEATSRLLAQALGLEEGTWTTAYQSQFGPEQWTGPATEHTLEDLAARGYRHVAVVCPGYAADCVTTLDEIGEAGAEVFHATGGERMTVAPCLNDHPIWLDAMAEIVRKESAGWIDETSPSFHLREIRAPRRMARAAGHGHALELARIK